MATFNGTEGNDTLIGGAAADDLHGLGGNDFLQGGDGADTVLGDGGNDTLSGNAGNDWMRGGTGNDQVSGGGGQDSFAFHDFGVTNADVLTDFSGGWDNIHLDASAFTALGTTGRFAAGDARFRLGASAQDTDDRIVYNQATGQLWYDADGNGAGAAQLIATLSNRASMSATDIHVFQSATPPPPPPPPPGGINGTEGDDSLVGTAGNDTINGFGGNDTLRGLAGNDSLDGGAGIDSLDGGTGADTMAGGTDDDLYVVDNPGDLVVEFINGGEDLVQSSISYTLPSWVNRLALLDGAAIDGIGNELDNVITGNGNSNNLVGNDGNDTLDGRWGYDTLVGGAGNDTFLMSATAYPELETLDGGAGTDTVDYSGGWAQSGILVELNVFPAGNIRGGNWNGTGHAQVTGIENIVGTQFGDAMTGNFAGNTFTGGSGEDTLNGDAGNDTLTGGAGNDRLAGEMGNDLLTGGAGADKFEFRIAGTANADTITDFASGSDKFILGGGMTSLGATGQFAAGDGRFWAAAGATAGHDADDRVIYNTTTRQLWYDADGSGSGAAQLIATLQAGANVAATDIIVFYESTGTRFFASQGNDSITGNDGAEWYDGFGGNDTLTGFGGNDIFFAGEGDDIVDSGAGVDTVEGGAGADIFVFSATPGAANADQVWDFASGADTIRLDGNVMPAVGPSGTFAGGDARFWAAAGANGGHDADDRIVYNSSTGQLWYDADGSGAGAAQLIATLQGAPALAATDIQVVNGSAAGATINGTAGNDSLVGTAGNDTINGFGGNDTIDGRGGIDSMVGGTGDDLYFVDNANDIIVELENGGIDEVQAFSAYTLPSWVNNLTMRGEARTGVGNELDNVIDGSRVEGANLSGMGGNDLLISGDFSGIHTLRGGDGNDTLRGGDHSDWMFGDSGDDVLDGGRAGSGIDTLTGGAGADDFLLTSIPGDAFFASTIADFVSGSDEIRFDGRAFTQIGASGDFVAGDARFHSGAGVNAAHDADDRVIYNTSTGQLWYDADGTGSAAAQLITTLQNAPTLLATDIAVDNGSGTPPPPPPPPGGTNGTEGNDTMIGTAGSDTLNGLGGNDFMQGQGSADTLRGGAGNDTIGGNDGLDWIEGGTGNDRLTGGSGQDAFVFREFGAANADTLTDLAGNNWDSLRFDNAAFTALGGDGRFVSGDGRFRAGTTAQDADDRIVYNSATGQVWYDADGNGAGTAQLVATLQAGATLVASDIWVI